MRDGAPGVLSCYIIKRHQCLQDRWRFGKLEPLDHYCVHRVMENGDRPLYATRLVGNEKWQAQVLLAENGTAIGYTGRFRPKKEGPHRRVKLGYAMASVKEEDTELLPLG